MINIDDIQTHLREEELDGWLFFDHHHRDPLAYRVLSLPDDLHVTRRWYYLIPATGEPRKLVHRIESRALASLPGSTRTYSRWAEQRGGLNDILMGCRKVAMQYSPDCAIPYVSNVDAGTMDLVRSTGVEVTSSAELIQYFEAKLDAHGLATHLEAGKHVDWVRQESFRFIRDRVQAKQPVNEWEVACFIQNQFTAAGMVTDSTPIVAFDAHAADPHYQPTRESASSAVTGTFVLLDMWAKMDSPGAVFYDITWTGYCGASAPDNICKVFDIVRDARDAAVNKVKSAVDAKREIRGFEVDDAARAVIETAGYGEQFVHRTGHSIGREVHGNGANMDNFETHDDRRIIPWSCFSVEPGIYLDRFGIRSEVNVFVDSTSARVTGEVQSELVLLG